jgi:uncharacterized protein
MTITHDLPTAYPSHPHSTEEHRQLAQDGLVFLTEVGSGVHGTSVSGTDDTDWMGVCVEPPEYVTGLRKINASGVWSDFEQFERHTAWDRAAGVRERSGAGDLDVVVYGLRKFCRLALDGNPSILTMLFVPESSIVKSTPLGKELLCMSWAFVARSAADRYLGYLHAQRRGMNGQGRVNRPELIEKYGFDVKFAGHAVRLGVQGVELMETGRITLPMQQEWRDYILRIRRGEVAQDNVMQAVALLERKLQLAKHWNPHGLPDQPNRRAVDRWLHRAYTDVWKGLVLRG